MARAMASRCVPTICGNGPIFGVYKVDDFERRCEIDRGRAGVPALGEPRVDERHVAVNLCGVVRDPQQ